jgi:hypothetical protein
MLFVSAVMLVFTNYSFNSMYEVTKQFDMVELKITNMIFIWYLSSFILSVFDALSMETTNWAAQSKKIDRI